MRYRQRKQRVLRAEQQLSSQLARATSQKASLCETFRSSLSPLRVLTAGAIAGWVTGKLSPIKLSGNTLQHGKTLLQLPALLLSLSPLLERLQQNAQPSPSQPAVTGHPEEHAE